MYADRVSERTELVGSFFVVYLSFAFEVSSDNVLTDWLTGQHKLTSLVSSVTESYYEPAMCSSFCQCVRESIYMFCHLLSLMCRRSEDRGYKNAKPKTQTKQNVLMPTCCVCVCVCRWTTNIMLWFNKLRLIVDLYRYTKGLVCKHTK